MKKFDWICGIIVIPLTAIFSSFKIFLETVKDNINNFNFVP